MNNIINNKNNSGLQDNIDDILKYLNIKTPNTCVLWYYQLIIVNKLEDLGRKKDIPDDERCDFNEIKI